MPHSGKAGWPSKLGPCGALWRSPCQLGRVITTSSHGHSARDGEMTGGSPTANTRPNLRGNDLQASAYTPLHRTREGVAGRGVLTSEASRWRATAASRWETCQWREITSAWLLTCTRRAHTLGHPLSKLPMTSGSGSRAHH
jgi:hypothetical protein